MGAAGGEQQRDGAFRGRAGGLGQDVGVDVGGQDDRGVAELVLDKPSGRPRPPGRGWRRLFSAAFFPLPNALAYGEAMIATLGESGLSSRDAAWAADTLTYYVVGHTIEEQLAVAQPGRGHDATARLTDAVDPQRHPHMYAALTHIPRRTIKNTSTTVSTSLSTASVPAPGDRDRPQPEIPASLQAGHDLLGGLAVVAKLATLRFATASVSCGRNAGWCA
jgi:hypothetical protein